MLFSASGPNGKFMLHGSETKNYFPAPINVAQNNCFSQKAVNGENVKVMRRPISGRNSLSHSKAQNANSTTIKKEMDVNSSPLMKAISGRINIGTEYLKEAMQKVFSVSNDNTDKSGMHLKSSTNLSPWNIPKASLNFHANSSSKNDNNAYKPLHFKENCEKQNTSKGFTLPPSIFHRQVEVYRTDECSSVDNLNKEMCHFRPIRLAPISPWKSGVNLPRRGVIVVPKPIMSRTHKIAENMDGSFVDANLNTRCSLLLPAHKSAFMGTVRTFDHVETKESISSRTRMYVKPVTKTTLKTRGTNNQKLACVKTEETSAENTIKTKLRSHNPEVEKKKSNSSKQVPRGLSKINRSQRTLGRQQKSYNAQVLNKKKMKKEHSSQNIGERLCSPPLTRSRLREMGKSNLTNALQYIGRYI